MGDIEPVFRVIVKTQSEWIKSATARNAVKEILDIIATKVLEYDKADRGKTQEEKDVVMYENKIMSCVL